MFILEKDFLEVKEPLEMITLDIRGSLFDPSQSQLCQLGAKDDS